MSQPSRHDHVNDCQRHFKIKIDSHPTMFSLKAARNIFTTPYRQPLPALSRGLNVHSIIGSTYPAPNETPYLKAARGKAHRFPVRYPSRPYEAITQSKLRSSQRRMRESAWKSFLTTIEDPKHPKMLAVQIMFDEHMIKENEITWAKSVYQKGIEAILCEGNIEWQRLYENRRNVLQFADINALHVEPGTLRPLFVRRDLWMANGRAWFTRAMYDNIHKVKPGGGWVAGSPWMAIICTTIRLQKKDGRVVWVLWSVLARKYGVWGHESEAEWSADGEPAVATEEEASAEGHQEKTRTEAEWKDVYWPSSQARRELNIRMEQ